MLSSRNYSPSPHLAPFAARHYVFNADLPADLELADRLLSETAFIRILLRGNWDAEVEPGQWSFPSPILFFGPNSRPLNVRVKGPFTIVGVALRACGWKGLFDEPASQLADRMIPLADLWGDIAIRLLTDIAWLEDDQAIVAAIEDAFTARLTRRDCWQIDRQMRLFEHIARNDSTTRVKQVASMLNLSTRQLERQCLASFGHSPKTIMRRSRFLDMASVMRGLGDPSEQQLAELCYFDQSHRTREFRRFIAMTPNQFARTPTPLFDAGLKLRHERKAEVLEDPISLGARLPMPLPHPLSPSHDHAGSSG